MNSGIAARASSSARTVRASRRSSCSSLAVAAALSIGLVQASLAQQAPSADAGTTLFQNVRIFDGKNTTLSAPSNVLVRGNKIEKISAQPIAVDRRADTRIIDGGGRTLMPGLSDVHWHAMLVRSTPTAVLWPATSATLNLLAGAEATATLMRGFTTVRDMGGPSFGLKRAIDEGVVAGSAHLSVRRDDHHHRRSRRFPPADRSAEDHRRDAQPCRATRRQHDRRQPGRGPPPRARATHAGRVADQAHGRRRCRLAVQPARRVYIHRARASRRGRSGRELGHLCQHPCLYARFDPTVDRGRREVSSSTGI